MHVSSYDCLLVSGVMFKELVALAAVHSKRRIYCNWFIIVCCCSHVYIHVGCVFALK